MLTIHATTKLFFTTDRVIRAVDAATRRNLSRFGAFVRSDARHSIRKRKRPSAPGQPPTNRTGLLKRHIYFAYDAAKKSVVIGPARLGGVKGDGAPRTLEYGGSAKVRNPRRRLRQVGDGGEIRVGGRDAATTKQGVTYCLIRTPAQARRANRLNRELYGAARVVRIAARPFMTPAFRKNLPAGARMWSGSVAGGGSFGAAYERAKGR